MRTSLRLDRTDRSNGSQLREDHEHAVGPLERPGRQPPEPVKPLAPARLRRQAVELVYEWEDVAGEGGEIVQRSFKCRSLRLVLPAKLREVAAQFVREAIDPAPPAIAAADHRGLHEQAFPTPRRPQLSVSDGCIRGWRRRVRCCGCGDVACALKCKRRDKLGVRRDPKIVPRLGLGGHTIGRGVRHLTEREILGELPRREPFGGAFE